MKVAIVYDRVNKWGGAERVLLSLHKLFPKAHLYTSVYDKKRAAWAKVFRVKPSFLQHIPFVRSHHELFPFLMPFAFASFSFKKYDLVISVTSEFAKGIMTGGRTKHLCICLTPTRYLWSGYSEYFPNKTIRLLASPLIWALRVWDGIIAKNPDRYIAISEEVKLRIKRYYRKDSDIVYPPVMVLPKSTNRLFEKDYFLIVSRLSRFTGYKRVDLAVRAATNLHASLIVVGAGDTRDLQKLAGPTVHFAGKVSDKELATYYANAKALIFPGKEDFGITMVEALSFGKPVIAYHAGGAKEIVKNGKTGTFFAHQTVVSLTKALKNFKGSKYNSATCKKEALRFSEKLFRKEIKSIVHNMNHKNTTSSQPSPKRRRRSRRRISR